ncbi:MAG: WG repeat-containing protein [Planctomycetota bacterium]
MNRKKLFTALLTAGILLVLTPLVLRMTATPAPGAEPAPPDFFPVRNADTGQWGFIDAKGKLVIPMVFDWAGDFRHGRGLVEHDGKMGYIDEAFKTQGDWAISPRFVCRDEADTPARGFAEGLALARDPETGRWGYLSTDGSWALEPTFAESIYFPGLPPVGPFSDGLATIQTITVRPQNVLDADGKLVKDEEGNAVKQDQPIERWGYIDTKGQVVIEAKFLGAQDFSEGLAGVRLRSHDRWGFINRSGRTVISPNFDGLGRFVDGLCPAKQGGLWGYIDPAGNWKIEPTFAEAGDFSEGLAAARRDQYWGYIDSAGNWAIPPRYDDGLGYGSAADPTPFENGIARVTEEGQIKYITTRGEAVWPK